MLSVFGDGVNSKRRDLEPLWGFAANQGQNSIAIVQEGLASKILTFVPTHLTDYLKHSIHSSDVEQKSLKQHYHSQDTLYRHKSHNYQ